MPMERKQALNTIAGLIKEHDLNLREVLAAAQRGGVMGTRYGTTIGYVLAYTGGILVLAGLAYYVSLVWDDMNSVMRVLITLGPGVIAQILGIAAAREMRFQHVATPLLIIAALFQPSGLFTFMGEYFQGADDAITAIVIFGVMSLQQLLLYARYQDAVYLIFTSIFATALFVNIMYKLDFDHNLIAVIIGLSGVFYSYGLQKFGFNLLPAFGYFLYLGAFGGGLFDIVQGHFPIDMLLLPPLALLFILASIYTASRAMLTISVLQSLLYITYFTEEYFNNIVGWPLALILCGLVMIGISGYAVRIGQRIRS